MNQISIVGACEHNLKNIDVTIPHHAITVITGVSGSGKSSLAFDTILREAQRRFFYTLSHYTRQYLDLGTKPLVKKISGLSPAIALAQHETTPSVRASVATLTDLGELFGVLLARFGERRCPKHQKPTSAVKLETLVEQFITNHTNELIAVCIPIATAKKGMFKAQLNHYVQKGYLRAYIDDQLVSITPIPELDKEKKHTIKIIVDVVKIKDSSKERFLRSINTAVEENDGFVECVLASKSGHIDLANLVTISTKEGCPECGFSWHPLDTRYFSANSLGMCQECKGRGVISDSDDCEQLDKLDYSYCQFCLGSGLSDVYASIYFKNKNIRDFYLTPIDMIHHWFSDWEKERSIFNEALRRVFDEITTQLSRIKTVDLGYLTLARRLLTLSGGELQRLKLAGILAENLRGVIYILDEPSQGLHPSQIESIVKTLVRLRDMGNTVILVDHDEFFIRSADYVIDMGPGGGVQGGHLIASFAPLNARDYVKQSATAFYLTKPMKLKVEENHLEQYEFFTLLNAQYRNVQIPSVKFLKTGINVVSGVSGAGKSTLIMDILYPSLINLSDKQQRTKKIKRVNCEGISGLEESDIIVQLINRQPISKSAVSIPATYLDIFTDLRNIYAKLPEAQILGLSAQSFSLFADGGRCPNCKGRGEVTLTMRFLTDARIRCSICNGTRYKEALLRIKYKGLSLAQVLDLTLSEAREHFAFHKNIIRKLQPAVDLGLGYLRLGQTCSSLSGGEAQRLKLAPALMRSVQTKKHQIYILDEPTRGLHFQDIEKLLNELRHLSKTGATIILIEHNLSFIAQADWIIDIGPDSAFNGGKLVFQGFPKDLLNIAASRTAYYLKQSIS